MPKPNPRRGEAVADIACALLLIAFGAYLFYAYFIASQAGGR